VDRLRHCQSNHLGLHEFGEFDAMAESTLAELGAISGKQNAFVHEITLFSLSQAEF
jgi:hypothetical protein